MSDDSQINLNGIFFLTRLKKYEANQIVSLMIVQLISFELVLMLDEPFSQHILRSLESLEGQDREHLPGMLASSLANQRIYTRL